MHTVAHVHIVLSAIRHMTHRLQTNCCKRINKLGLLPISLLFKSVRTICICCMIAAARFTWLRELLDLRLLHPFPLMAPLDIIRLLRAMPPLLAHPTSTTSQPLAHQQARLFALPSLHMKAVLGHLRHWLVFPVCRNVELSDHLQMLLLQLPILGSTLSPTLLALTRALGLLFGDWRSEII
jgi:hypothetical protein